MTLPTGTYTNFDIPEPRRDDPERDEPGDAHPRNMRLIPRNPQAITIDMRHRDPIHFLLGDSQITIDGGFGGFQEVARPKDSAISDWPGTPVLKLSIPIIIDNWVDRETSGVIVNDVRNRVDRLFDIGRGQAEDRHPPGFRVYGKAMPPRTQGLKFALESLEWGDSFIHRGNWVRQSLILHVMEFEREDNIKIKRRKRKHHHHHHGHHRKYHVRKGDTLMIIAKKVYGDWRKWRLLQKKNHVKNPRKLKVGSIIIIP